MFRESRLAIESRAQRFAEFTVDVIYGRQTGKRAMIYGAFLYLLSLPYSFVVQLRWWLYRKRIFQDQPLGCLVVVVGNLTVGGTGKTPVVEKFARSLAERVRKVAILSRGYKSRPDPLWQRLWRKMTYGTPPPPKVVSDGENVLLDSEVAGNEPYMLAKNLLGGLDIVDKDRL